MELRLEKRSRQDSDEDSSSLREKNARDFEAFVKYVNCDETITCRFTMSNRCEYVTSVNSRYESYFRGRVIFSTQITHVTS